MAYFCQGFYYSLVVSVGLLNKFEKFGAQLQQFPAVQMENKYTLYIFL